MKGYSTWRHDDYFVTRFFFLFLSLLMPVSAFPLTGHIYLFICPSIFRVGAICAILPALFPSIINTFSAVTSEPEPFRSHDEIALT